MQIWTSEMRSFDYNKVYNVHVTSFYFYSLTIARTH